MEVGSWKLEVGSWKLEVGSWKLEVGNWKKKRAKTNVLTLLSNFYLLKSYLKSASVTPSFIFISFTLKSKFIGPDFKTTL